MSQPASSSVASTSAPGGMLPCSLREQGSVSLRFASLRALQCGHTTEDADVIRRSAPLWFSPTAQPCAAGRTGSGSGSGTSMRMRVIASSPNLWRGQWRPGRAKRSYAADRRSRVGRGPVVRSAQDRTRVGDRPRWRDWPRIWRAAGRLRSRPGDLSGTESGAGSGPPRRVLVPAPAQEQGLRAEREDGVQAAGVVRVAGGESRVFCPAE